MRSSKAEIVRRVHALPTIAYDEAKRLTSFSGLVLFFALFRALDLFGELRRCFEHLGRGQLFGMARVVLQLVVHVVLGFRRLRDRDYYADDPLICRMLGVSRLPDVATISRTLAGADGKSVINLRGLVRNLVLKRIASLKLARITIDFDSSVLSTARPTARGLRYRAKCGMCSLQSGRGPAEHSLACAPWTDSSVQPRGGLPSLLLQSSTCLR